MSDSRTTPELGRTALGPVENLAVGVKVLASELAWLIIKGFRAWEIRQLSKQLEKQYTELGRLQEAGAPDEARELAEKQVGFLREEIGHLKADLAARRDQYVAARLSRWGLAR